MSWRKIALPTDPRSISFAVRIVWAGVAAFILLLIGALYAAHQIANERTRQQVLSLARLVEEHAASTITRASLALQFAGDLPSPGELARPGTLSEPRRAQIQKALVAIQQRTPGVVSMSMTDAAGYVFANSVGTAPGTYLGDRKYFGDLKSSPGKAPVVSEAIKGRVSNKWGIQVARRLELADGSFGGMVVANLGLAENFEKFYESIRLGGDSLITLRDQENRILVRYPVIPEVLGKILPATSAARLAVESGAAENVVESTSPLDHIERIVALRKLQELPIYASVGLSKRAAFDVWRIQLAATFLLGIVALLVGRYLTAMLHARAQAELKLRELNTTLEERVVERTASLEEAIKDLEAFSYSTSHDLRAPLRAINGYARILIDSEKAKLSDESQHMLERIATNASKLGDLIDDILDYTRAGRQDLTPEKVDLGLLVATIRDDVKQRYPRTRWDIDALPTVRGDTTMLRQIFQNLIENACKFSGQREQPRVWIGAEQDNERVVVRVRDNGVGFDMQYAKKLFSMFHRMHSEAEFHGTGVGLAIVKRLVERHGGTVWAEAQSDQGATFHISLPKMPQ